VKRITKIVLVAGGILIAEIAFFAVQDLMTAFTIKGLRSDSRAFVLSTIPEICKDWQADTIVKYSIPSVERVSETADFKNHVLAFKEKLGPFQGIRGTLLYEICMRHIIGKYTATLQCALLGYFKNDHAVTINVMAVKAHGKWMIHGFSVNSQALMCLNGNEELF